MNITASDPKGQRDGTLLSLQAGRGIAAFAVVLHHAGQASDAFTSGAWGWLFEWGYLGVDFFFVLSGFIIFHAHGADRRDWQAASRFIKKRLRRIFVPYLPVALTMIAAYALLPGLSQADRDWGWFTTLTLLPSGQPPALSVAWTLVFEMCFYLVFLLSFYLGILLPVAVVWSVATVLVWALGLGGSLVAPIADYLLHPLVLEFLLGMAAAWAFGRMPPAQGRVWLSLGAVGVLIFALWPDLHRVGFGLALVPLVLGLALIEKARPIRVPAMLVQLGAASYALYLVHNPLMSLVARAIGPMDSWTLSFVLCCLSAVLAGLAYHYFYERPVLRLFSQTAPSPQSKERSC
ncbi:MAG: acyltransferase family protein [Thalassovita sp.]